MLGYKAHHMTAQLRLLVEITEGYWSEEEIVGLSDWKRFQVTFKLSLILRQIKWMRWKTSLEKPQWSIKIDSLLFFLLWIRITRTSNKLRHLYRKLNKVKKNWNGLNCSWYNFLSFDEIPESLTKWRLPVARAWSCFGITWLKLVMSQVWSERRPFLTSDVPVCGYRC